jgi:hypothetical protein
MDVYGSGLPSLIAFTRTGHTTNRFRTNGQRHFSWEAANAVLREDVHISCPH